MRALRFRQDISSRIVVPADGRSTTGTATALAIQQLQDGLQQGATLSVSQDVTAPISTHPVAANGADQYLLVQSAGSTGAAKTIRRRPASWIASFDVTRSRFGVSANTPYAVLGALGHSLSLYAVLEALHLGADLSVLTGLSPRGQRAALQHASTQVLYATPTQLRLLSERADRPLPTMRRVFSGGGKLDPNTRQWLVHLFPNAELHEFFGASETSFITISDAGTPAGSVGRAYPGVDLCVRDVSGATTTGPGEVWVKSPYLFEGYSERDSQDTKWHDGYLTIGEMGQLDENGYLTVLGRKNRMVTVADCNVFPEAIEAQMLKHQNVGKCAAIAVADPIRGQSIVGIVEGGNDQALAKTLIRSCQIALGVHAAPRRIVFVDDMPLLGAGKPDLQGLARMIDRAG